MFILLRLGFFECLPSEVSCYPYKPKSRGSLRGKNDAILEINRIKEQEAGDIINKVEREITINTDYKIYQPPKYKPF